MPKIPIKIIGNETEKSKECRTIVYIDGQNFLHRCTESLIYSGAITSQQESAVKIARQLGKKVTYVGFKYQLTNAIVKRTDDIFEINRLVVLEAYTSALNQLLDKHSTIEI